MAVAKYTRNKRGFLLLVFHNRRQSARVLPCLLLAGALAACGSAPQTVDAPVSDPFQAQNRAVHSFNQKLRSPRPKTRSAPPEVKLVVNNFTQNLSMPKVAVNALLQGNLRGAALATYRFAVNTGVGMGGIADVATEFGAPKIDTDFGETLHVWGVGEGPYLVLPLAGPTTTRDAAGRVVDALINPLSGRFKGRDAVVPTLAPLLNKRLQSTSTGRIPYEQERADHITTRRNALNAGPIRP